MKAKIIISIICACSLFYVQAQEEWEYVCSLTGESLRKVYAQGTDIVYVVGENGLIAKSTDKGLTWDKKYFSNGEALNDIIFCTDDIGFIVGNNGTILKTQNAGSSWEQMASGTVLNINAIAVFDLNNIWAVGNNGLIIHSTDIGEIWTIKALLSDNRNLKDVKCKEDKGYIVGQGGIILNTENRGTTWQEQILTGYYGIRSLSITDSKVYALGDYNIIFTEDNVNWHTLSATMASAIYFQDDQKGFKLFYDRPVSGGSNSVWIDSTTDGGNTWVEVYSNSFREEYPSDHCNFAFSSNNEFGYFILGSYLMRTPYTGEFTTEIVEVKSEKPILILSQKGNELQINSESKMIDRVEFITTDGRKTMQKTKQANIINIDVTNLPKGFCLVNVIFFDNTNYLVKWIK